MKKLISLLVAACILLTCACVADNPSFIIPANGGYDPDTYPRAEVDAAFTADSVAVDGVRDAAYDASATADIVNIKNIIDEYPEGLAPEGKLYTLWDGALLYLFIEVKDLTPQTDGGEGGANGSNPAYPAGADSVTIGVDFYHDQVVYETDTIGTFSVDRAGTLHFYRNSGIPSLGSVLADPIHPEYLNRINSYAAGVLTDADGNEAGYTIEAAIQIEGLDAANGTVLGLEVQINDAASYEQLGLTKPEPAPAAEGQQPAEVPDVRIISNVFLSHAQDSVYARINESSPSCVDWADLTLTGWDGEAPYALSTWRITNMTRYLDSISFPKDVYTAESQAALDTARADAEAVLEATDMAVINAAADALEAAVANLRWADTKYPDPDELPDQMTLPNPYKFFGSDRVVESSEDWAERRAEILDLAQFYEYGYKPGAPEKAEITAIEHFSVGDVRHILFWGFWPMDVTITCPTDVVTLSVTDNGVTATLEYTVYLPTEEQLAASGHTDGKIPAVLSYDGDNETFRNAGIAVVNIPSGSGGDGRTNEYAWGQRTGAFYELYPSSRNGEGALKEVSSEMAAAWAATRVIDSLETIGSCEIEYADEIAALVDPTKLAVTGFSINGKYAFVAAVFDERIGVCIPGAAGASGPSPWRYVYTGHEYDWTGTPFAPADETAVSAKQYSTGTEVMANSVRHNRVRETELFRQFLTPFNFYKRLEGAYGFGTRLPYDQNDLIATLAPRAIVLLNTVNDYNDGCEADSLGLEVAKAVYRALGYDADDLVKFNQRGVQPGEPHGSEVSQHIRTAEYLNYYFCGEDMSEETAVWLNTDPFALPVCNGQTESPYDYYYGGYNTITGGTEGKTGTDGWYYYEFPNK